MQPIGSLLKKKSKNPLFKKILLHAELQRKVKYFFEKEHILVLVEEYNEKRALLTLKTSHPSLANEVMFLREKLNAFLKKGGLPKILTIKVLVDSGLKGH